MDSDNKSVNHVIFVVDHSRSMRMKDAHAQCVDSPASRIEAVRRELRRFCLHQQASQLSDRDLYSIWIFDESPRCLVSCVDVGVATKMVDTFKFSPKNGTFYREGELQILKYIFGGTVISVCTRVAIFHALSVCSCLVTTALP